MEVRRRALELLQIADPVVKAEATRRAFDPLEPHVHVDVAAVFEPEPGSVPGRPAAPRLVPPAQVPQRPIHTPAGRAALLHAVAHIEFNAINLALDAVWRFPELPPGYYTDWARVAAEEALHFTLVAEHLRHLNHAYGDFDAHDGLWTMAERTRDDPLARMALVPRTLEARGLDVTPGMRARFVAAGDTRAADILDVILRDEIGHVAIGNRWYHWLCERAQADPMARHEQLAHERRAPRPRGPFNRAARAAAGFTVAELDRLERWA